MKQKLIVFIFVLFLMIIIPFIAIGANDPIINNNTISEKPKSSEQSKQPAKVEVVEIKAQAVVSSKSEESDTSYQTFKMFDKSIDSVIEVPDNEFLYGAVICEMSPSFEVEALKAQTVATYTYFCRERNAIRTNPKEELKGADFEVDTANWKFYTTKENMQKKWGSNFDTYYKRVTDAVDSVFGETLKTQNGELILAMYHAISSGTTEKSSDVFGGDVAYLEAVASPGDLFAPNYKTQNEFSIDDFKNIVNSNWGDVNLGDDPQNFIKDIEKSDSGMIKKLKIGDKEVSGIEVRTALSLRSANFDVEFNNDKFTFTTKGYGHCVGMSQYGAQYMAKQGSTYSEILHWYYKV